jgi:hypothetical protein
MFDWRRAAKKHEATVAAAAPPFDLNALLAKLPKTLLPKLMQVREKLSPDEQRHISQLISLLEPEMIDALAARAEALSVDQLTDYLRAQIAKPAA